MIDVSLYNSLDNDIETLYQRIYTMNRKCKWNQFVTPTITLPYSSTIGGELVH